MFGTYKNKDELKLKFKLLNSSFVSLFLYFMILQSYGNIVNFGGIQISVSIVDTEFLNLQI
ncbi:hypothetical protein OFO10_06835 [Campylobacter sp. VBCF_06 NA8]|uniref:hypothetical protein n=1 Tax=unclassified Campylobacter TaxID=2593542 RepID=UPI0022E99C06|nr:MULTISPECIES: hypothetical protein [unclassified Campylobacter]MDA3046870.1 hypothetical protein [Campylobacter sp. VBCF_06 NA8]MDA3048469.1 hypothetical protein [Campylobacter sp. JMF_08 NE1]